MLTAPSLLLRRFAIIALCVLVVLPSGVAARADPGSVTRIGGRDRYEVAANTVLASLRPGAAPTIFIASGEVYADALAAGPAAMAERGVLLLTRKNSLPEPTINALRVMKPQHIVIAGGTATVSAAVETRLRAFTTGGVTRVGGRDRYEVAGSLAAREAWRKEDGPVFLASGEIYSDAVAASGIASAHGAPVLLTRKGSLPASTAARLDALDPTRIVVVGGASTVSESVKKAASKYGPTVRIGGKDRYEVSVNLAKDYARYRDQLDMSATTPVVTVTSGTAWADSLAASNLPVPLLLTRSTSVPSSVSSAVTRLHVWHAYIVGGTATVSPGVESSLRKQVG